MSELNYYQREPLACATADEGHAPVRKRAAEPEPERKAATGKSAEEFRALTPTVRVVPPVAALLDDVRNLVKGGLDHLKLRGGSLSPMDVRTLEGLARTAKLCQDMTRAMDEDLSGKLDKLDKAQLAALLADPSKLLRGDDDSKG